MNRSTNTLQRTAVRAQAALTSSEGVATAADLGNFAQAGVEMLMFDTREV